MVKDCQYFMLYSNSILHFCALLQIVKISPEVLAKCLTIIVEFLQNKNVTVFNPCLRSLVTTFVCPALEAQDTTSRVLALHALSNSCLLDVDLAKQYFLLFCFQVCNFCSYL